MKTNKWIYFIISSIVIVIISMSSNSDTASAEELNLNTTQQVVTFPVAFQRATKDAINSITADGKGEILTISDKYLNITRDYGKTWVSRSLPSSAIYHQIRIVQGVYYLSNSYTFNGESHYYSTDAVNWTPFTLEADNGLKLGIGNIQIVHGTRILLATSEKSNKVYVFTSPDGLNWVQKGSINDILWTGSPIIIWWNGSGYSAIAGGHSYYNYKKTTEINHFLVNPKDDVGAELIVYTSSDLINWKLRSGAVNKKLFYTWNTTDIATGKFVPERNYYVYEEQPIDKGIISLFDMYSNQLTSRDGITFNFKKSAAIFHKYSNDDYRTPIFQLNNQYYVFTQYWYSSGVIRTRLLTSKDKLNWKETKLNIMNKMEVIQSGKMFIGYNAKEVAISSNGMNWKKIK
ncbi:hypothetical protein [Paenibacillus sp. UMB4589-SE434]|uniref:hypothetical protein n=1 Tax=Paenibacillus sp. UMB4589-SE434 TaxID=3046314 RepID=UPI00254FB366|nr:hypothetical protein [Paenibacillus sp. UMB4589-SE434]MDK8180173.1 hypothetical protein [Paenibacillus sp. UMB4589-SE434]